MLFGQEGSEFEFAEGSQFAFEGEEDRVRLVPGLVPSLDRPLAESAAMQGVYCITDSPFIT